MERWSFLSEKKGKQRRIGCRLSFLFCFRRTNVFAINAKSRLYPQKLCRPPFLATTQYFLFPEKHISVETMISPYIPMCHTLYCNECKFSLCFTIFYFNFGHIISLFWMSSHTHTFHKYNVIDYSFFLQPRLKTQHSFFFTTSWHARRDCTKHSVISNGHNSVFWLISYITNQKRPRLIAH